MDTSPPPTHVHTQRERERDCPSGPIAHGHQTMTDSLPAHQPHQTCKIPLDNTREREIEDKVQCDGKRAV